MKFISPEKYYKFCPSCKTKLVRKSIDGRPRLTCQKCGFVFWNNPKPVVSVLLEKEGRILMLKRAHEPFKRYWVLPGGFMEYDETPEEAIKREAKEEAGIDIIVDKLIGVYQIDDDPRGIHVDIIFSGKWSGVISLDEDLGEYKSFKTNKLPKKIAYKHREAIRDSLKMK